MPEASNLQGVCFALPVSEEVHTQLTYRNDQCLVSTHLYLLVKPALVGLCLPFFTMQLWRCSIHPGGRKC